MSGGGQSSMTVEEDVKALEKNEGSEGGMADDKKKGGPCSSWYIDTGWWARMWESMGN